MRCCFIPAKIFHHSTYSSIDSGFPQHCSGSMLPCPVWMNECLRGRLMSSPDTVSSAKIAVRIRHRIKPVRLRTARLSLYSQMFRDVLTIWKATSPKYKWHFVCFVSFTPGSTSSLGLLCFEHLFLLFGVQRKTITKDSRLSHCNSTQICLQRPNTLAKYAKQYKTHKKLKSSGVLFCSYTSSVYAQEKRRIR